MSTTKVRRPAPTAKLWMEVNGPKNQDKIRKVFIEACKASGSSDKTLFDLGQSIGEVVSNAFQHGTGCCKASLKIYASNEEGTEPDVVIAIRSCGCFQLPKVIEMPNPEKLQERGYGFSMISLFVENLRIRNDHKANIAEIIFEKNFGPKPLAA